MGTISRLFTDAALFGERLPLCRGYQRTAVHYSTLVTPTKKNFPPSHVILGIPASASNKQIEEAYKNLCIENKKMKNPVEANKQRIDIEQAYKELTKKGKLVTPSGKDGKGWVAFGLASRTRDELLPKITTAYNDTWVKVSTNPKIKGLTESAQRNWNQLTLNEIKDKTTVAWKKTTSDPRVKTLGNKTKAATKNIGQSTKSLWETVRASETMKKPREFLMSFVRSRKQADVSGKKEFHEEVIIPYESVIRGVFIVATFYLALTFGLWALENTLYLLGAVLSAIFK